MNIFEKISQLLTDATCPHCGKPAFSPIGDTIAELPDLELNGQEWVEVVREYALALKDIPSPARLPRFASSEESMEVFVQKARASMMKAIELKDRLHEERQTMRTAFNRDAIENADRQLQIAEQNAAHHSMTYQERLHEQSTYCAARDTRAQFLANITPSTSERDRCFEALFNALDTATRQLLINPPLWVTNIKNYKPDHNIEDRIDLVRDVLFYRYMWSITDQVSPLGPAIAPGSDPLQEAMREARDKGYRYTEVDRALDFSKPLHRHH